MGLELAHGGHLTHGIDMDALERTARECRPRLIIAGWSAYPRHLDFARFEAVAKDVGALLMVDMAHFAGLAAAGLHPNPVPYADVVTTTIHKTLGGARGGMVICREEHAKKINSAVFPGQQGGPLEHVIAGKAVTLLVAAGPVFRERQQRTLAGAQMIAERLAAAEKRDPRAHRRHRRAPRRRGSA
jgi:glycine hydroxymethyltransferase